MSEFQNRITLAMLSRKVYVVVRGKERCGMNGIDIEICNDISNGIIINKNNQVEDLGIDHSMIPIKVLQEIRQEIAESKYNHRGEYNRELAFNICLQIIDIKINEYTNE